MAKWNQLLAKGKRFLFVSALLKLKLSDKIRFENLPYPVYLRRKTSDIPTFHQIFTFKDYDINLGFAPQIIIDAGANIGLAAIFFANKYPEAKIVSVEPEKLNYGILQKNVNEYQNVVPLKRAISNEAGIVVNVIDNGGGNWAFVTNSSAESPSGRIVDSVTTITIAEIMTENGFAHIDLLKIDIEGAERELFSNNYESWLPKTKCLIIELHDGFKQGCSKSFFKAISNYDFKYSYKGENLIFFNLNAV